MAAWIDPARLASKTRVASSFRSSTSAVARHAANLTLLALTPMRSRRFSVLLLFFPSFLPFFFFFSFSSPSLDSLLCHLQWLVDAGWRRGHLASEEYSHRWSRVYRRFLSSYAKHRGPLFHGISRGTSRCLESRNHASIFASLHTIPRNFASLCILFDAGKTLMRGSLFLGIIEKGRRKGRRKS